MGTAPGGEIVAQTQVRPGGAGVNWALPGDCPIAKNPMTTSLSDSLASCVLPASPLSLPDDSGVKTPAVASAIALATVFTARIAPDGPAFAAPASLALLQAAEQAGLSLLESSCRNGTCRTCICQLVSGQVTYRIEWPGLSLDEKREGFILPCVAHAASDVVLALPFQV